MSRPTRRQLLDFALDRGFDMSTIDSRLATHIRVKCSQCDAVVVNHTPIHETGCPNETKECTECACRMPARPVHRKVCDACLEDERIYHGMDGTHICEASLPWAKDPCPNTATGDDGFCDECRAIINDNDGENQ